MKSREAIRNRIISYAGIVWNTKRIERIHPLIHLMIEELTDELYRMYGKLRNIDSTILEKLVRNLVPTEYDYVRAACGIVQVRPESNCFFLSRKSEFFIKEMPDDLRNLRIETVAFSPVTDVMLHNLGISRIFYNRKLWKVDGLGNKKQIGETHRRHTGNKLWMLLDNPEKMERVKDLYFYLAFPHLDDNHDYYQSLCLLKWEAGGISLQMEAGLPLAADAVPGKAESDALSYYSIHYRSVKTELHLNGTSCRQIPGELALVPEDEQSGVLPPGCWISLEFPAHFRPEDIERMHILLNAFPALNRRYVELFQDAGRFRGTVALPSEPGEEFLELEHVEDNLGNRYVPGDAGQRSKQGVYSLESTREQDTHGTLLHDNLELLADVLARERTLFPGVDKDEVTEIRNAVASLQQEDDKKVERNILGEHTRVARLNVHLRKDAAALHAGYWTTLGETANDLPAGTGLMAGQVTVLNKSEATLITPVTGGRIFYDPESLKAINRFYMTSKGRILTKHDILSFCRIEVGKYAKAIDAVRCGKISPRPGEGIVNAMEIRIIPNEQHRDYFKRKEVLRWLKLRLEERSPIHYNYFITVIES